MGLPVAALNHLLAQNAWARERLSPFAGRCFALDAFPLPRLVFTVTAEGGVTQPGGQLPDVTLSATPDALLRFLLLTPRDRGLVRIHGDHALGEVLLEVLPALDWEVEEDLSRLFGDVIGHRLAQFGRAFWQWRAGSALSLAGALAEYLSEERPLLTSRGRFARFAADVAETAAAVDRLEARIGRLAGRR